VDIILGAGLSGLICGALNARSQIIERNKSSFVSHRAVLRFRDEKIAKALGLTFRKVQVYKSIWEDGHEVQPTPRIANLYSRKTRGIITNNSIWNIVPSERYIAPDDLHAVLADICGRRVQWEHEINTNELNHFRETKRQIVSTLPLPILLQILQIKTAFEFRYAPVIVTRYRVSSCDVYQTVYFPSLEQTLYRATLTGSLLTIESLGDRYTEELQQATTALGIAGMQLAPVGAAHKQTFGKIAPLPEEERRALLHQLTQNYGVYTLGRFATWRNILLDDVYDDIGSIRKMMTLSHYDMTLERTK
jgi:hypothetical protein